MAPKGACEKISRDGYAVTRERLAMLLVLVVFREIIRICSEHRAVADDADRGTLRDGS